MQLMTQSKRFQRHIENFNCDYCGTIVHGDGYTNHCPNCFYSKHVDLHPGDRLAVCNGLMPPVAIESRHGQWVIVQQCVQCNKVMSNRLHKNDSIDKLIELQKKLITAIIK